MKEELGSTYGLIEETVNEAKDHVLLALDAMCVPQFPTGGAAWHHALITKLLETHGVVAANKDSLMTIMSAAAYRCE